MDRARGAKKSIVHTGAVELVLFSPVPSQVASVPLVLPEYPPNSGCKTNLTVHIKPSNKKDGERTFESELRIFASE